MSGWCARTTSSAGGTSPPLAYVFVPYDREKGPDLGADQSVLVPYAEFLKLRGTAQGQPEASDFRPFVALGQAVFSGEITEDVAVMDSELVIETAARPKDLLTVRLPFEGASAERVQVEGGSAVVKPADGASGLEVRLTGPGRRTVKMRLAARVKTDGAMRRLEFGIPRPAAASLRLRVADEPDLEATPESVPATVARLADGKWEITASAGGADRVVLNWKPKARPEAAVESRVSVAQEIRVMATARTATADVRFRATLLSGTTTTLTFDLPAGAQLVGVSGPLVKEWGVVAGNDRRVKVTLSRERGDPFDVKADVKLGDDGSGRISVPEFRVPGAVRESGIVTVMPDDGLAVWAEELAGVESVSMGEVPPGSRVFRFAQPGWKVVLSRRAIEARVLADGVIVYEVTDDQVRLKTRHKLTISGRGIFDAVFEVPEGFELRDAGPPEVVGGFRQTGRRVEVNLRGEQRAPVDLALTLQRKRSAGDGSLRLLPVKVVRAEEDSGSVIVAAPVALRVTESAAAGLQPTDVRTLGPRLQGLLSADIVPVLGYRYFASAFDASAAVERQRTRLTCETSMLASITPSLLRMDATLQYNVEFSATDELQVLVPATAGEEVRITAADLKEKVRSKPADGAAMTTWTIRLQRKVLGPYRLGVSFDVPLAAGDAGKPLRMTVPVVRALQVARETAFVAVSRGENLEVSVAASEALEPRDPKELPGNLASAFLGFRSFEPEKQRLELELVRHEIESVLGALIRRMHVDTVLSDQREAVHEAVFEVQNNREQYLALRLPKGVEIWSAFVRGTPVRPTTRASDGARLIELTKSETRDSAFRVRLILKESLGQGALGWRGTLRFDPPEPLNMPVLRMTRKLYLPPSCRYTDFGGTMQPVTGTAVPWMEPGAEKLLGDLPATLAGGVGAQVVRPQVAVEPSAYDTGETEQEKRARLQGAALEIPIVRQGVQYEFSKLSGVGDIVVSYWNRKALLALRIGAALAAFLAGMLAAGFKIRPGRCLSVVLVTLVGASVTTGTAGIVATATLAGAGSALGFLLLVVVVRNSLNRPPKPAKPSDEALMTLGIRLDNLAARMDAADAASAPAPSADVPGNPDAPESAPKA